MFQNNQMFQKNLFNVPKKPPQMFQKTKCSKKTSLMFQKTTLNVPKKNHLKCSKKPYVPDEPNVPKKPHQISKKTKCSKKNTLYVPKKPP